MGRPKGSGGAKRGPKPKATKADLEAAVKLLSTQLRAVKKLVRQIHAVVVPDSTEGTPEPEPIEPEVTAETAETAETPTSDLQANGAAAALPVEAEVVVVQAATLPPPQSSLNLKPAV